MCLWNTDAPSSNSPKLAIFSIKVMVKVTRSLTLVSFKRVFISWVWMPKMKSLPLKVQKLWPRLKFFAKSQTDRTKTRCPRIPFRGHNKTRHVFVKHQYPRRQQSQNMAKSVSPKFWPSPTPRGMWCQWGASNPEVNSQSKFGNCITTQTLISAIFIEAGWNYGQTDKWTDNPITIDAPCRPLRPGT